MISFTSYQQTKNIVIQSMMMMMMMIDDKKSLALHHIGK
jgi:hypothetical protein